MSTLAEPVRSMGASAQSRVQAWFAAQPAWRRFAVALLAGAVATLGHAPFQVALLFMAALTVLVWLLDVSATRAQPIRSAFATGFWFALGHMTTGLYWLSSAFNVDSSAWGPIWGVPATLALAAGMALFWAVGCALAIAFWAKTWRRIPTLALALFITEWTRGHVFGGFPWLLPGYVWTAGAPISQLASLVGIYGLTLITLLAAAAPAAVADGQFSAAKRFAPLVLTALFLGMAWGWGAGRLNSAPIDPPGAQPQVRVADAGLSQADKWRYSPDQEWRVLARYLQVSGAADEEAAPILIWPEGAIPTLNFFMLDNPQFLAALGRGLGDRALVTGLSRCEPPQACDEWMYQRRGDPNALRLYNSATVIDGVGGQVRLSGQVYDKHRLVPFGEFIPLWSMVSQLNIAPLQRIGAGFTAGEMPTRLIVPEAQPAVVLICYEAIFPGMVPRGAERPGWIINVTNDAWFGDGSGPWQHYQMARYRSIEEGLPLARAASGGVSAIVDAFGREISSARGGEGAAQAQLPPALGETLFARAGILLLPIMVMGVCGIAFLGRKRSEG
ncbi:MAG: apolipoprotein N-acyltransferase [Hyphomonadaceae bacterium]|nr:apolipoprotein N-acyltransferase [Hyphomonadaceae bacterium]